MLWKVGKKLMIWNRQDDDKWLYEKHQWMCSNIHRLMSWYPINHIRWGKSRQHNCCWKSYQIRCSTLFFKLLKNESDQKTNNRIIFKLMNQQKKLETKKVEENAIEWTSASYWRWYYRSNVWINVVSMFIIVKYNKHAIQIIIIITKAAKKQQPNNETKYKPNMYQRRANKK